MAPSPTLRRLQLGRELRQLRDSVGLTREALAKEMGSSPSMVARYEAGNTGLQATELKWLMDRFGVSDPAEREQLERLRAESRQRGWWSGYRNALRSSYLTMIGLEESASTIREFASVMVPGMLQTEDYARAVLNMFVPELSPAVIEERIKVRLQRQQLLTREEEPVRVHVLLDEAIVQRQVGGETVWKGQLRHLLELGAHRHIMIQVLPFTAGAIADVLGAFTLLDFAERTPIAYVELPSGDLYAVDEDAAMYLQRWDTLRTAALPPPLSARLIRGWLDE